METKKKYYYTIKDESGTICPRTILQNGDDIGKGIVEEFADDGDHVVKIKVVEVDKI